MCAVRGAERERFGETIYTSAARLTYQSSSDDRARFTMEYFTCCILIVILQSRSK